jgi:hypothetical protein
VHVECVLKLACAAPLWLHRGVLGGLGSQLKRLMGVAAAVVRCAVAPAGKGSGAIGGWVLDLTRSRKELLAENAFLRHQLLVAVRKVKRPKLRAANRIVLVGLAALFASWRNTLVLVQPETLLRWHSCSAGSGRAGASRRAHRSRGWRRK